jgi:O-antigen/teichoic acid export membrane protein
MRAFVRTALAFGTVALCWLAVASFLPNFHLANTTTGARVLFVAIVLVLLALILLAQLTMLRSWFRSLEHYRPDRKPQIARLRVGMLVLVLAGVAVGLTVLWYATWEWMPQVQRAVEAGESDPSPEEP